MTILFLRGVALLAINFGDDDFKYLILWQMGEGLMRVLGKFRRLNVKLIAAVRKLW